MNAIGRRNFLFRLFFVSYFHKMPGKLLRGGSSIGLNGTDTLGGTPPNFDGAALLWVGKSGWPSFVNYKEASLFCCRFLPRAKKKARLVLSHR